MKNLAGTYKDVPASSIVIIPLAHGKFAARALIDGGQRRMSAAIRSSWPKDSTAVIIIANHPVEAYLITQKNQAPATQIIGSGHPRHARLRHILANNSGVDPRSSMRRHSARMETPLSPMERAQVAGSPRPHRSSNTPQDRELRPASAHAGSRGCTRKGTTCFAIEPVSRASARHHRDERSVLCRDLDDRA